MNNEFIKEIKGKEYHFKFKSKKLVDLEKITGKTIVDLLHEMNFTNLSRILKYSCLEEIDEYELLDSLLEELSLEEVVIQVILPILKVSGIISQKDLDKINEKMTTEETDQKN